MREINLRSKKYPDKALIIDEEDYEKVNQFKWYLLDSNKNGTTFYAISSINGKTVLLHKFLVGPGIDHVNGNGLDCRKENLRPANRQQQAMNRRFKKNKTGHMGVYFTNLSKIKPYQASIRLNGKNRSLGYYSTPEEASLVREQKAQEWFGTFYRGATQ